MLFCPGRESATWPRIARAGHFCANVLAADQRELARTFGVGATGADKFAGVRWSPSLVRGAGPGRRADLGRVRGGGGARGRGPLLVLGRVTELGECRRGRRCCSTAAATPTAAQPADGPPEIVDTLLAWPRHADWM